MEMIETITRRELPDAFDGTYDAKGVHNIARNEFHEAGPGATRWVAPTTFEFSGRMKLVGLLFGRSFPKQSYVYMEAFKKFAEGAQEATTLRGPRVLTRPGRRRRRAVQWPGRPAARGEEHPERG